MICLQLRYLAHISMITGRIEESYQTEATTLGGLLKELEGKYPGFREVFVNRQTGQVNMNAMIFYHGPGQIPAPVMNLDQPLQEEGTITFW